MKNLIKEQINDIPLTYLYIKTHQTGLKYFGKTCQDPYLYSGSGTRWINHIRKHGNFVETTILGCFTSSKEIFEVATKFSIENSIVESKEWANCRIENGLDGGSNGPHSEATKKLISEKNKGVPKSSEAREKMKEYHSIKREKNLSKQKKKLSEEERLEKRKEAGKKISKALTGKKRKPFSAETRRKISLSKQGKSVSAETRKKLSLIQKGKPKSKEHNLKVSESLKGRKFSQETKEKMKIAAKNRTKRTDYTKNSLAMKGRVWWNNGVDQRREKESPGIEWIRGPLKIKKPNA